MPRKESFIVLFVFLTSVLCEGFGSKTTCASIFYKDARGINSMEKNLLKKCESKLAELSLNDSNGCIKCINGVVNGQYPYETKVDFSRLCWGSVSTCASKATIDVDSEFKKFMDQFNSESGFKTIDTIGTLEFINITYEKEETLTADSITVKKISHTKNSVTYSVSSNVNFPIQCYKKLLDEGKPSNFARDDTYIVLTPNAKDKIFTTGIGGGKFDCQKYQLAFKCYPIPYQYTVESSVEIPKALEIDHRQSVAVPGETDSCDLIENNEEKIENSESGREPETLPSLLTDDPLIYDTKDIDEVKKKPLGEQHLELEKVKSTIASNISSASSIVDKINFAVKGNQYIEEISCGNTTTTESCIETKTNIQAEIWKELGKILTSGQLIQNLKSSNDKFDITIKLVLQIIILSTNNNRFMDSETSNTILQATSKIISSSKEIFEEIKKMKLSEEEDTLEDVFSLMSSSASSTFQIIQSEKFDGKSKKLIEFSGKSKNLYRSIKDLSENLVQYNRRIASTNYYTFLYTPLAVDKVEVGKKEETKRLLQETTNNKNATKEKQEKDPFEAYNSYTYEDMEISVPLTYIRKKLNDENIGLSLFTYNTYPLITVKGMKTFSTKVVSVNLVKNTTKGLKKVNVNLPGGLPLRLIFKNTSYTGNFSKCYGMSPEKSPSPSFDNVFRESVNITDKGELVFDDKYIVCGSYKFGDFLIGEYNPGMTGVGIFFLVFFFLNIIAWGVFCWYVYKKYIKASEGNEPKTTDASEKPKEKQRVKQNIRNSSDLENMKPSTVKVAKATKKK